MQFDIEEWQRLAREDPGEFERRRQAAIESFISQAPAEHRERLRGLQFRIDLERRRAKTALGAAVRLQSMMWERFGQLREALLALTADTPSDRHTGARILPFRKPD
ncbi:MAG TPA: DUF3135 domain-containing protein [Burkholderiales bacterium]|nr:DUF3135 domain-containing protein [Burkholderiales bacterium]